MSALLNLLYETWFFFVIVVQQLVHIVFQMLFFVVRDVVFFRELEHQELIARFFELPTGTWPK